MDYKLLSIIISASVAIFIAVLNHFIITPIKDKRNRQREQLKNLYAPLYNLLSYNILILKDASIRQKEILLGYVQSDKNNYKSKDYLEEFMLQRAGYCSDELMEVWTKFTTYNISPENGISSRLVKTVVKEYNKIKKELNMGYNKEELSTGIPECIKELREEI
ncbi:hypothetical protein ACJA3J_15110 [Halobacillus sp. SY10]|uniref:hypothetical protein n=1 Tax=Halobacillus sp. SY10 TaxID=3381356 RepID=UPI0038791522